MKSSAFVEDLKRAIRRTAFRLLQAGAKTAAKILEDMSFESSYLSA